MDSHQFFFIIILCLLVIFWIRQLVVIRMSTESGPKPKTPRPLKPKTADDCPFCQADKDKQDNPLPEQSLKPWSEVKSSRGRKKTHSTQGYACPNLDCNYFGIGDEHIHALVGYGRHGKTDTIQDLRCQACGRKFSVRWGTALYRLKTSSAKVALILALMAEGVEPQSVVDNRNAPISAGFFVQSNHRAENQGGVGGKLTRVVIPPFFLLTHSRALRQWITDEFHD